MDGRRIGFVESPAYRYADGGGGWHDFGALATDGAVAWLGEGPGRSRLISLADVSRVRVVLPEGQRVEPLDASGAPVTGADAQPRREGDGLMLNGAGIDAWVISAP